MVALSNRWRNRGIGSALLAELEMRLRTLGVRRISALLPADATGTAALRNSGYTERTESELLREGSITSAPSDAGLLADARRASHAAWTLAGDGGHGGREANHRAAHRAAARRARCGRAGTGCRRRRRSSCSARPARGRRASPRPLRVGSVGRSSSCSRRGLPHLTSRWRPRCARRSATLIGTRSRGGLHRRGRGDRRVAAQGSRPIPAHGVTNELLKLIPTFRSTTSAC